MGLNQSCPFEGFELLLSGSHLAAIRIDLKSLKVPEGGNGIQTEIRQIEWQEMALGH